MMAHRISTRAPRREAGFSLIEALIALLVVAFGLLGIASFQYTLSQASDVAKQRTEATRIAQREIDRLRSFGQRQAEIVANPDRLTYVEDVIDSNGPQPVNGVTTNTAYSMTTTVGVPSPAPASGDRYRWINVVVEWADRTGQAQSVRLATVISDGDPSDLGPLGVTRRLSATLRPKNRNINVPYPAVNIATCPAGSTGCSAFVPPPGNVAYVFDNVTGNVIQSCALTQYSITALSSTGTTATATLATHPFTANSFVDVSGADPAGYNGTFRVSVSGATFSYAVQSGLTTPAIVTAATARWALVEGIDLANLPGGVSCTTYTNEAYLLSGYVRFVTSGTPNADDIINTSGNTFDLLLAGPLTITTTAGQAPLVPPICYAQRQRVVATPNVRGETIAANGYSRVSNVVTITTTRNHSFTPGMVIAVTGTSNYVLQGQFEIISVPGNRTLTYGEIGPDTTASGGRVELIQQLTIAQSDPVPSAYNAANPVSTFVAYTCVVTPSTTGTPREWWGRLNLVPETDPAGGTRATWDTTSYRVCRYTADYNGFGLTNSDHPSYYRQVTGTLDNQNFVVIPAAATCPTDTTPTFTGNQAGNFNNTNTAAHQPTPSDSPGEPASPGDSIDME